MADTNAIPPCTYVEIRDNHTCLGLAILPCSYVEIRDNHTDLGSVILPCTYAEIRDNHMISTYEQGRMAETKHV
jgi:ferredoxin-thioredoxin reductase catalytic subunit